MKPVLFYFQISLILVGGLLGHSAEANSPASAHSTETSLHFPFPESAYKEMEVAHQGNLKAQEKYYVDGKAPVSFKATIFHFLGEVEAIFGIWLVPLLLAMVLMKPEGLSLAAHYIDTRNFTEPIFVVVIMAIASSRPVVQIAQTSMRAVASLGKQSPAAWWLSILIVAPLLGSFITEPAAMTIAALLLGQQFYQFEPSSRFKYATLGLLFVNISVGGTLTHFAAPPILMVAETWNWNLPMMFTHFGWRAIIGIIVSTSVYYFIFRKDFAALEKQVRSQAAAEDSKVKAEPAPLCSCYCRDKSQIREHVRQRV